MVQLHHHAVVQNRRIHCGHQAHAQFVHRSILEARTHRLKVNCQSLCQQNAITVRNQVCFLDFSITNHSFFEVLVKLFEICIVFFFNFLLCFDLIRCQLFSLWCNSIAKVAWPSKIEQFITNKACTITQFIWKRSKCTMGPNSSTFYRSGQFATPGTWFDSY